MGASIFSLLAFAGMAMAANNARRYQASILRLARNDSLTGLPNRFCFNETLERLTQESDSPFALLIVDLDGFKNVNDTQGHPTGDKLLIEVARRISREIRNMDYVGQAWRRRVRDPPGRRPFARRGEGARHADHPPPVRAFRGRQASSRDRRERGHRAQLAAYSTRMN